MDKYGRTLVDVYPDVGAWPRASRAPTTGAPGAVGVVLEDTHLLHELVEQATAVLVHRPQAAEGRREDAPVAAVGQRAHRLR